MAKAVICDLDGTLCDIRHRLHHVAHGGHDWDAFFAGIPDDDLCIPVASIISTMNTCGYYVLFVSGRPEKCRNVTIAWLAKWGVRYDGLYMRPDNDTRPDHIVKAQILDGIIQDGYDPLLVIDDRQSVVDMWRERGLTCLQCAPSEAEIPKTAVLNLMVGPSGAGKSTWLALEAEAKRDFGIKSDHIISSDRIRAELCGDFRDQSKNEQVFSAVHALAKARLRHGLPTTIDATHLRRRDRMAAVALTEGKCPVRYLVMNRPMQTKRADGGWRNEVKKNGEPFDLIGKHEQTFHSQKREIFAGDNLPNVAVFWVEIGGAPPLVMRPFPYVGGVAA